jgi:serine/threonine protein phosphatase PrpC
MPHLHIASLSDSAPGETVCGDLTLHVALPGATPAPNSADGAHWLLLIDGLGHGAAAAHAAHTAADAVRRAGQHTTTPADDLPSQLADLDGALAGTRGAAVGWMWLQGRRLRHAGVGNTRALRWRAGQVLRLPSHYGVLGDGQWAAAAAAGNRPGWPHMQEIDVAAGDWLLLFSDGLDESLQLDVMRPEWEREPSALCEHLLARWRQSRDDAAVLVARVLP